jgi:phosphoribosylformylglycinamidine (FGAM) synthase PurS component
MGLFAKAAEKSAASTKSSKPKKNTTWVVGDPEGDAVAKAVHELVELTAQEKALAAKKKLQATIVLKVAKTNHVRDFCDLGVPPDTPMLVQNSDGEKVTFIVQDRGGQYNVKPEQIEAMQQLLGEDAANDLLYTETTLGFDRTVLGIPGVGEAIEKALERVVTKLVKDEKLTPEQADELITAKQKTSFKPGTLDRAATIVGRDTTKLAAFLDAMGSSCTRYIKS